MATCPTPISRPWQDIAREMARETNRNRVLELAEELNRAMAQQMTQTTKSSRFRAGVNAGMKIQAATILIGRSILTSLKPANGRKWEYEP
jgi:hypothetical protein